MDKLKITYRKIGELTHYINNARLHPESQITTLVGSIKEFDFTQPILIDTKDTIIAGHARLEAARKAGLDEIPTITLSHLTKTQQRAYILADNRIALDATWDMDLLKLEMVTLKDEGFDISLTGFDSDTLKEFDSGTDGLTDPDSIPDEQSQIISKEGDVWLLGCHRVMCGDSTIIDSVTKLMNNIPPVLMVTDPPYGVNYDPSWRDKSSLGLRKRSLGKVSNDNVSNWKDAYSLFKGNIAYVWHAGKYTHIVAQNLIDCGFDIVSQIIWAKNNFAISRGDYHWKHESCWYAVKKDCNHNWNGKRDQSTLWEINSTHQKDENEKVGHGTQKPVLCMERPIINNSKPGDCIYDPFGVSGTTLIACEKTNRKCLMMEIAPHYCDVIVRRWQEFTGKEAILESTGYTFNEIMDNGTTG